MTLQIVQEEDSGKFFIRQMYFFGLIPSISYIDAKCLQRGQIDTWITPDCVLRWCSFDTVEQIDKVIEMFKEKQAKPFKIKIIKTVKV